MLGKITAGLLSDAVGGKPVLLLSATGYIVCTALFALVPSNYPAYLIIWFVNGFFALGLTWVAVVAVASNWIPVSHMGRLMALVSLAPQLGDVLARAMLAPVVSATGDWRRVFQIAAGSAAVITIPAILFAPNQPHLNTMRTSLRDIYHHGTHELGKEGPPAATAKPSFWSRTRVLLTKALLYVVAILSGSLYGIRVLFLSTPRPTSR